MPRLEGQGFLVAADVICFQHQPHPVTKATCRTSKRAKSVLAPSPKHLLIHSSPLTRNSTYLSHPIQELQICFCNPSSAMLPCSVRRVAVTAPQTPILSNFGSSVPRTAATALTLSYRRTQNGRYSSSKPSRDNGSEGLPVGRSAQPADAKASESKSSGDKRKRKAKDVAEKQKYPSVPSTSHISPDCMFVFLLFLRNPAAVGNFG